MPEFLLELFSEEIPARMQGKAADDLARLLTGALKEAGVPFGAVRAYATPRRLAAVIEDLPLSQADTMEERRGPRADAPPQAIEGFLKSAGVLREQLETRTDGKGAFFYAMIGKKGRPVAGLLAEAIPAIVQTFPWPKSQRWGSGSLRWVRPLHSILAVFDGAVVPFSVDGVDSGNISFGHRFLSPEPFQVSNFAGYREALRQRHVILDAGERRAAILEGAERLAAKEGLTLVADGALADEVAGLVEWPISLPGRFDERFMDVPEECLISEMRSHQKYFALRDGNGKLANRFVITANMEAADGGAAITAGNERVLAARLSDAKFFWDQDRKMKLADRAPKLAEIVFHQKLGTLADKIVRIENILRAYAPEFERRYPGFDVERAVAAARLAKCDLVTGMVGEFPELQGVMGRYYALHDGVNAEIADAIRDHYAPLGPGDACPVAPLSVAVAFADKLDTILEFFRIGEKPTGSKDPFALRRAGLGIIRLVVENGLRLRLPVEAGLIEFFMERLKVQQREKGVRHDLIDAVFSLADNKQNDLVLLLARVSALSAFLETEDGVNLLAGYKRASNILRIEEKKDGAGVTGSVDAGSLAEAEEIALHEALAAASGLIEAAIGFEDFGAAMAHLARLRTPIDAFFDKVLVNDPAHRANRLRLLKGITEAAGRIADFSRIEGA